MPRTPLLEPKRYFDERERPSAGRAGWIVISFWAVSTVAIVAFVRSLEPATGVRETAAASSVLAQTLVVSVYGVSALWLTVGVALHHLARWAGGTGRFFDALAIGGWAFAPPQLLAPVVLPLSIYLARAAVRRPEPSGVVVSDGVAALVRSGLFDVALAVVASWTIAVWAHGLERAYGLPFRVAVACSAAVSGAVFSAAFALTLGLR